MPLCAPEKMAKMSYINKYLKDFQMFSFIVKLRKKALNVILY